MLYFLICFTLCVPSFGFENMNGPYANSIANPAPGVPFSTDWSTKNVEYFEVYSHPITTRYAEVYWAFQDPIPLPAHIVASFQGKMMAVVGFEIDLVSMDENNIEQSVPLYHSYNHHIGFWLSSGPLGAALKNTTTSKPLVVSFLVGAEARGSFNGDPKGFAKLIHSPTTLNIQPMVIDTRNRDYNGTGFKAGLLPKASTAPVDADYSGLIECPCTDRTKKTWKKIYSTEFINKTCSKQFSSATECFAAQDWIGLNITASQVASDPTLPNGCLLIPINNSTALYSLIYNSNSDSRVSCDVNLSPWQSFYGKATSAIKLELYYMSSTVYIKMTGPVGVWFAVGFDAKTMSDKPHVIVVDGDGGVSERRIDDHSPGIVIETQVVIVDSITNTDGTRTVTLKRQMQGLTPHHYTFSFRQTNIPFISAVGTTPVFSYHGPKRLSSNILMVAENSVNCLCPPIINAQINGVSHTFGCEAYPLTDLLVQKNPSCSIETYSGGHRCCAHGTILLDSNQVVDPRKDTVFYKIRFYYQTYIPSSLSNPASHKSLKLFLFETEAYNSEHDVIPCTKGTNPSECIYKLTARFKTTDMTSPLPTDMKPPLPTDPVSLISIHGHCHAPSCLSMSLYNADTGSLLCHIEPLYGKGNPNDKFDELSYLKVLPRCLFGEKSEGLQEPPVISRNTNLYAVKISNATVAHYGDMAYWFISAYW